MSTVNLGSYISNLLSIAMPVIALPAIYGSKLIKTWGRKYTLLESLRIANPEFDGFYHEIEVPLNNLGILAAFIIFALLALSVISLIVVNLD